jgi:hypothetical protein
MSIERVEQPDALHLYRYTFASRYVEPGDTVLDCACGTGYGKDLLNADTWIGADKIGPLVVDLETWIPEFDFDVFVGLETIEHLHDYTAYVQACKRSKRTIVLSTPIVPTKHVNDFHFQDFTRQQIEDLFSDWTVADYEQQTDTYGLWVFTR